MDNFDNAKSPKKHSQRVRCNHTHSHEPSALCNQKDDPQPLRVFRGRSSNLLFMSTRKAPLIPRSLTPIHSSISGHHGKVDHISYVVHHIDDLLAAEELLTQAKITSKTGGASPLRRWLTHDVRFKNPSGTTIK